MADFLEEVERCIPSLRRYARVLQADRERADDLVQDCLERALSRRHFFRPGGNLRGWLLTILHNLHVNDIRRQAVRRRSVPLETVEATLGTPPEQGGRLIALDLRAALARLSEDQRQVILLVGVEGMAYKEVAALLGLPLGTVMSRLARGRERLRALMEGEDAPGLRRVR